MNGQYFRYCDDMIFIIDEEFEDRLSNLISERISRIKLKINDKKTQKITFINGKVKINKVAVRLVKKAVPSVFKMSMIDIPLIKPVTKPATTTVARVSNFITNPITTITIPISLIASFICFSSSFVKLQNNYTNKCRYMQIDRDNVSLKYKLNTLTFYDI